MFFVFGGAAALGGGWRPAGNTHIRHTYGPMFSDIRALVALYNRSFSRTPSPAPNGS